MSSGRPALESWCRRRWCLVWGLLSQTEVSTRVAGGGGVSWHRRRAGGLCLCLGPLPCGAQVRGEGSGQGGGCEWMGTGAARLSATLGRADGDQPTWRQTGARVAMLGGVLGGGKTRGPWPCRVAPLCTPFAPPGQWVRWLCPRLGGARLPPRGGGERPGGFSALGELSLPVLSFLPPPPPDPAAPLPPSPSPLYCPPSSL